MSQVHGLTLVVAVGTRLPNRDPLHRTGAHIEPSAEDEMRLRAAQFTMFTWVQIPHLDLCISYSVRATTGRQAMKQD